MEWEFEEAKQRFSQVVRNALTSGPQVVTRHGRDAVVVVALDQFSRLRGEAKDFKTFLRAAPDIGGLNLTRDRTLSRRVKL